VAFTIEYPAGAGGVPQVLPLGAPHDATPGPVVVEPEFPANVNPLEITTDQFEFVVGATEKAKLLSLGFILPGANPSTYRIRRPLHIVYPAESLASVAVAGRGLLPIVVLVHGNHAWRRGDVIVDNHKGYRYLQEELAIRGFVSVSVDTNVANAFRALNTMRADLVVSALDTLSTLNGDASSVFHNRLDLSRVGLFGHSRGGDAVVAAARTIATRAPRSVKFVCSLAPTDVTGQVSADQRLVLEPQHCSFYAVLYGTQDGDVSGAGGARNAFGTGFRHYDRARTAKSMVFLEGCTHNRFNTVWMTDTGDEDLPPEVTPELEVVHQDLAKEYVGSLASWHLVGDTTGKDLFDGRQLNARGVPASVQWSFGNPVEKVDDMEGTRPRTLVRAAISEFADVRVGARTLELETNHQTRVLAIEPALPAPAAAMVLTLSGSQRNLQPFRWLTLRATAVFDLSSEAAIGAGSLADFTVAVRDGAGTLFPLLPVPTPGSGHRPSFHEDLTDLPDIVTVDPAGPGTRLEMGVASHNLVVGDRVLIEPALGAVKTRHTVTAAGATDFRVAESIAVPPVGIHLLAWEIENVSVHRLETFSYLLPELGDARSIEITPAASFPQHIVIDSLELIEP
jgi:hypothetical protein